MADAGHWHHWRYFSSGFEGGRYFVYSYLIEHDSFRAKECEPPTVRVPLPDVDPFYTIEAVELLAISA